MGKKKSGLKPSTAVANDERPTKKAFDKKKWRENKYSNKVKSKIYSLVR